jgi:hypothetical protein
LTLREKLLKIKLMKKLLFFFLLILTPLLLVKNQALAVNKASDSAQNKTVEIKKGEVIDQDFFAQGSDIKIDGIVNGDVYVAGGNISLAGKIDGDLIAAGGHISLDGEITQNMRVAGQTILVKGKIGRNLTVFSNQVIIEEGAVIGGNLLGFGKTIVVNGDVGRDVRIYGNQVSVNSQIGRNLKGSFGNLTLSEKTKILGDLDYQSSKEAEILPGAIISGQTNYQQLASDSWSWSNHLPKKAAIPFFFGLAGLALWFKIMAFLLALGFGLLFFYFFPKRVENMAKIISQRPWACLGWGLLVPFIFALAIIFLIITLIGIPLIFVLLPLFGLLLYFAKLFTAFFLGRKILGQKKAWGWTLLVGLLIYYLLSSILFLNGLVGLFFTAFGLGAFVLDQKNLRKTARLALKTSKKK